MNAEQAIALVIFVGLAWGISVMVFPGERKDD